MIFFSFIKRANLANFADDNSIYATSKDIASFLETSKSESEKAINWFEKTTFLQIPIGFKPLLFTIIKNINEKYTLKVNNIEIESKNSVKLLVVH